MKIKKNYFFILFYIKKKLMESDNAPTPIIINKNDNPNEIIEEKKRRKKEEIKEENKEEKKEEIKEEKKEEKKEVIKEENKEEKKEYIKEEDDNINLDIEVLNEQYKDYDLSFKIIVIGNSGVGKSCLALKATKDIFEEQFMSTIGFEFFNFNIKINSKVIKLQIWDTCGQEVYRSLISNFYRSSSLAILVYAIDNEESFDDLNNWIKELKINSNPNIKVFIIGNKNDLEDKRKVSFDKGKNFCKVNEFHLFMETSAKSGFNAKKLFINAAKLLYKDFIKLKNEGDLMKLNEENLLMKERKNLKLGNNNEEQSSYGCC
jgi:small GTP-binding protein